MSIVNFYDPRPSANQLYNDMLNGELAVFDDLPTSARQLHAQVEALGVSCALHQENTIEPWNGEDYFVMTPENFGYMEIREQLRQLALHWITSGRGNVTTTI